LLGNATAFAQKEPIIYKLFPSLEKYILSPEGNNCRDICGFAIQYKYGSALYGHDGFANDSMFILYVLNFHDIRIEKALHNSNSYIEIYNNYYPVFIMFFEDSFSNNKSIKNKRYREQYYFNYNTPDCIYVNMTNETFYKQ